LPSSQLDNNINDDGGYAAAPAIGVQLQHVASDQQQEQDNKAKEGSKKTTTIVGRLCTATGSTPKQRRGRGVVSYFQLQPQEG
jgi:hypothetical protein